MACVSSKQCSSTTEISSYILQSESDSRLYEAFTLDNGLRVLLVSDETTDKSAACLSVNIGSLSDPLELPGLAHFCEHMLFLGTTDYPDENAYLKFISEHGGSSNAFTSAVETSFAFDITTGSLFEALLIFSRFFICPLFTASAAEREVNAVHSEHEKNLCNDFRRWLQLDRCLSCQAHDYAKFSTGNRESLLTTPVAKGICIRSELLEFHRKHYSANQMSLAVLGKESLEKLKTRATELFSGIADKGCSSKTWNSSPWTNEVLGKKISMVPINDVHDLCLMWPIPDYFNFYKAQPGNYLTHLIGHESSGSLLSELKRTGLVNGLCTEIYRPASGFASFLVRINLTEAGVDRIEDIINLSFQYINMLSSEGPQEWIFDEMRDLCSLRFKFKDNARPYDYAVSLASRLQRYPVEDVLSAGNLLAEYRPDLIKNILSQLTPNNLRYFVISKKLASVCHMTEKWYGTKYTHEAISQETLLTWRNCGFNEQFHLPKPNAYIPTDFTLRTCDLHSQELSALETPLLVRQSEGSRLWVAKDYTFHLPKTFINCLLHSPILRQDPVTDILAGLYCRIFVDSINEELYACELAGTCFSMRAMSQGVILQIAGYSHKMSVILDTIVKQIAAFLQPDRSRFDCLLEATILGVNNFVTASAYQQADGHLQAVLSDGVWPFAVRKAAVKALTYERLLKFISNFCACMFVEMLVYGNVDVAEAERFHDRFIEVMRQEAGMLPPITPIHAISREVLLASGDAFVYQQHNEHQPTSAIIIYLQCSEQSTEANALAELFCHIIREPAFTVLRTEKQLGYIVYADIRRSNLMQGISILIQSEGHPCKLEEHIETFFEDIKVMLDTMTVEQFQCHVNSLKGILLEVPKTMPQKNRRYWNEVLCHHYNFNRAQAVAKQLESVEKDHVRNFYEMYIDPESTTRKKMSMHVVSKSVHGSHLPNLHENYKCKVIESPIEFKRQYPLSGCATSFTDLSTTFQSC